LARMSKDINRFTRWMSVFDDKFALVSLALKNVLANSEQAFNDGHTFEKKIAVSDFVGAGEAYYDLVVLVIGSES